MCANAVILNTYARGRGEKREKFRQPSHEEGEIERSRRTVRLGTRVWGSDLELAGDVGMGMGMDPELRSLAEVCGTFYILRGGFEGRWTSSVKWPNN